MTNTTLIVLMEDENVHSDERPFCDDPICPCKDDLEMFYEFIAGPLRDGLLTSAEAKRFFGGQQL